ncbi:MAG: helix-turn-helix domain-containing protein [Microbacterium sp.]|jgi:HTH-type transcriptional regulator/antitoxin HipB|nr:helix-turn-helix domain-containing protein [Microbacterium sp.]
MTDTSVPSTQSRRSLDTSGYIRRARRLADLSQRDLGVAAGMLQSQISRFESGQRLGVDDFSRLLAVAGLRIAIVDEDGAEVFPMPADVLRDRAGRRRPAHLDSHAFPEKPTFKMLLRTAEPWTAWHHHRAERDRQRDETGRDEHTEQLTVSDAAARKAARRTTRRTGARRQHVLP